jgi:hypothetical protein
VTVRRGGPRGSDLAAASRGAVARGVVMRVARQVRGGDAGDRSGRVAGCDDTLDSEAGAKWDRRSNVSETGDKDLQSVARAQGARGKGTERAL